MARILIVTGRLAENIVRKAIAHSNTKHVVDVVVAPVDVAAFLTPRYIAEYLKARGVSKDRYDLVIVPGAVCGSCKIVEEVLGIRAVKGTINAHDLDYILRLDDLSILSEEKPADEILGEIAERKNREILVEIERKALMEGFRVGGVAIPLNPPPIRVVSEIAYANRVSLEDLRKKIRRFIDEGADIVSLGFEALEPHPDDVYKVVRFVKGEFDVPIAIDTEIPSEIIKGIEAGCDIVINVSLVNIDKVQRHIRDVAVVAIPRDPDTNTIPRDPEAKVWILIRAIERLKSIGVEKIIADAVLDPPGNVFNSLTAYSKFKKANPRVPMLMGIGNVVELMDVDSVGLNAFLVEIAQEIGVSLVLVSEHSVKARGSTREAKIAAQMMAISYTKNSPPKDLGLSLLILKDKKLRDQPFNEKIEEVITASEERTWPLDPMGIFKIRVNHDDGVIEALYIGRKGRILIKGSTAKAVRDEILARGLVSLLSHAVYIGMELAKAEEALRLGKSYIQEMPLFTLPKPLDLKAQIEGYKD